jgi:hypothetical protein
MISASCGEMHSNMKLYILQKAWHEVENLHNREGCGNQVKKKESVSAWSKQ